jgi:hypothetical protein
MTAKLGVIGVLVLGSIAVPGVSAPQLFVPAQDVEALQAWTLNIEQYLVIRDLAAQSAPPPRVPSSAAELLRAEFAFAAEIRARRPGAREGDVFTADIQRTFRRLIARAISEHEIAVADLLDAFLSDVVPGASRPGVNRRFSWQIGTAMPGCLLEALPLLPEGLQYRLSGRDLILLDVDANLIIDILREALPRHTASRPVRP